MRLEQLNSQFVCDQKQLESMTHRQQREIDAARNKVLDLESEVKQLENEVQYYKRSKKDLEDKVRELINSNIDKVDSQLQSESEHRDNLQNVEDGKVLDFKDLKLDQTQNISKHLRSKTFTETTELI